ncbi:MAG: SMP-30/gluconolactonase/LRE family protein [Gemmatimonadaceae bacterium]|nr:SMP-30/gluconolactonase/LRE family protein [Gemmatimonadaceae bacterium]
MRRVVVFLAGTLGLLLAYLLAWPVPVSPVAWQAPPNPGYTGPFAANTALSAMSLVPIGPDRAPEALAVDRTGRLYAATESGWIVRLAPDGTAPTRWVNTGGRPLGMAFDTAGSLWVADSFKGLLAVSPDGAVRVAAITTSAGDTIRYADDVDVARDGRVYVSDATTKFHPPQWNGLEASLLEILEHRGHGRLLEHDPRTGATTMLADGLVFANGVALSHDELSVLVNETGSYRVLRVVRDGPRRGTVTTLVDALPGFPDNIKRGTDGRYWVALISPRNALVDRLSGRPSLRAIIRRLPAFVRPAPVHYGHVIAIDDAGRVRQSLQDPSGRLPSLTMALEVPGYLYLGSLAAPTAARLRVGAER